MTGQSVDSRKIKEQTRNKIRSNIIPNLSQTKKDEHFKQTEFPFSGVRFILKEEVLQFRVIYDFCKLEQ